MHEDALYDTVLLGKLCHLHKTLIRIAAILADDVLHPVALVVDILLIVVLVPKLDLSSRNRNIDYAHTIVGRKNLNHFSTEEIHRAEVVAFTTDRRHGSVPFPHLTPEVGHVDGCHELETRIVEILVLLGRCGTGFHVGLTDTEVDVKFGVGLTLRGR